MANTSATVCTVQVVDIITLVPWTVKVVNSTVNRNHYHMVCVIGTESTDCHIRYVDLIRWQTAQFVLTTGTWYALYSKYSEAELGLKYSCGIYAPSISSASQVVYCTILGLCNGNFMVTVSQDIFNIIHYE